MRTQNKHTAEVKQVDPLDSKVNVALIDDYDDILRMRREEVVVVLGGITGGHT